MRKHVFLAFIAATGVALGLRAWMPAAGLFALGFTWVLWETHERTRFSFIARRACPEGHVRLGSAVQALAVSRTAPWALVLEAGPTVSLLGLLDGKVHWTRVLEGGALALVVRPDGRLLWASADRLHLTGPDGKDVAELAFEAPLYRQSYKLLLSGDGSRALLHTPWFIQVFDPDLKGLGPRLRYEEAGHYMKYAVLSDDGRRLYTAGALLLDEEEGGAAMEARWDGWDLEDERCVNLWKHAYESYSNSHLRGLSLSADGQLLCAELYQEGYEFRLHLPDGSLRWKRAGEHPVLSPQGAYVLWENRFDGVVLTRLADQQKVFSRAFEEKVRFKTVTEDGSCFIAAGTRLYKIGASGETLWEAAFRADPSDLALGPDGRLAVFAGDHAAVLRLPWGG
jgi:hypothetical protein